MEHSVREKPEEIKNPIFSAYMGLLSRHIEIIGIAAEEQVKAAELEEAAMTDPLTGIHNRRALDDTYNNLQQGQAHRREQDRLISDKQDTHALILLDVDNFKLVNDTFGHVKGDEVLIGVAKHITERTRSRDIVCRLGGDEFAVVLPRSDQANAAKVAEEIRANIYEECGITLSGGISELDLSENLDENIRRADIALYTAKKQGRDRLVLEPRHAD